LYLAVIGGLVLSVAASAHLYHWERQAAANEFESRFQLDAQEILGAIRRELGSDLQTLRALGALYEASERVTRQEFRAFVGKLLESNGTLQALEWIPRVHLADRARYEESARPAMAGFEITERGADGSLIPAPPREVYYPVYFVEPLAGNETAAGFDLGSEPVRRQALERARDTGQMAASGPLVLIQETTEQYAFLACLPIYQAGAPTLTTDQRRSSLQGFVLGVWRFGEMVDKALSQFSLPEIDLWVSDTTDPAEGLPLYPSPASSHRQGPRPPPATTELSARFALELGGRDWTVIAAPAPGEPVPPVGYSAWLVLFTGLTMTGLLFRYLHALQVHAKELLHTNRCLDREIEERRQAEAALKSSELRLRQVLESAGDVILICDEGGRILIANSETERLFGYTREEIIDRPVELLLPGEQRERHVAHRTDYFSHKNQRPMGGGLELVAQRKDGSLLPVEISLSPVQLGEDRIVTAIVRDISKRQETEAELRRLNRTHAVLSRCAKSLASAIDEAALLQAYCRNLVEVGGYCWAWVGYTRDRPITGLRLMAEAGRAEGDPSIVATSWGNGAQNLRPSELAVSTAEPVVLRGEEERPYSAQSPQEASQRSCRSMVALPLKTDNRAFGSFSIFSADPNAFNEKEVALLEELAEDLALGIGTLRARIAHEQRVRLLREEVEQEERRRIAATIHDGVGQSMQAVNLGLKRLRALADADRSSAADLLQRIIEDVAGVITDLRDISHDLRPLFLERMGLRQAIQYHCGEMKERTDIAVHFTYDHSSSELAPRVKRQCFLCFREALSNALRHAKASRIDVTLESRPPDSLTIRIADDGVGFDPQKMSQLPSGLGLAMISERAASIGGSAAIHSLPDGGTTVTLTVPLTEALPWDERQAEPRQTG